jgi:hypothetical protein
MLTSSGLGACQKINPLPPSTHCLSLALLKLHSRKSK